MDDDEFWFCSNAKCLYADIGFPVVSGLPVLIDFEQSIFSRDEFTIRNGASMVQRDAERFSLKAAIKKLLLGTNETAALASNLILKEMKKCAARPRLLVVGGGTIGSGVEGLYESSDIELVGVDVYVSPHTHIVADGHKLPFVDESFDGVWIQAVLEHVLNPAEVVAEIRRVLKPQGVVYADTPFMQQVHEHAYDFTRFTLSGHRWLFRDFSLLGAGAVGGAGSAMIWSIRYLVRAITASDKLATAISLCFFWLRFFDRIARSSPNADAASGVFFFGRKAEEPLDAKSMLRFYDQRVEAASLEAIVARLQSATP